MEHIVNQKADEHLKFINNFVNDYCKSEEDKKEFFNHLWGLVSEEVEIEKQSNI